MFCQMVRKEMLEGLLDVRFALSMLITVTLFAASTSIATKRCREEAEVYWHRVNENLSGFQEQSDQLYKLAFYEHHVYRRPKVSALCAAGSEELLPGHLTFDGFQADLPRITGQSNFTLPRYSELDWAFIISLVLSFTALVFSHDCICGEKVRGTLRLILAGTAPRATVLLAKYVGLMLMLGVPLLLGLLTGFVVLLASGLEAVGLIPWLRLVGMVPVSLLYLSIFVLLGMFVSARTSRPSNAMATLLLLWVVLLIVIPSLGRVISDKFGRAPSLEEFARAKSEAREESYRRVDSGVYGLHVGGTVPDRNDPAVNPSGRAQADNDLTDALNRVADAHFNRMLTQAETGRHFTYVSPAVVYRRVCEVLAGTGIDRCRNLYQQVKTYQQTLRTYIRLEDQRDPDSLHLLFDDSQRMADWTAISHRPVNFEAVPKFQERDLSLEASLRLVVWDIGLLVSINLFFFAAAFVSFLRYDAR